MKFLNEDNNDNFSSRFRSYSIYLNLKYNNITFKQLMISNIYNHMYTCSDEYTSGYEVYVYEETNLLSNASYYIVMYYNMSCHIDLCLLENDNNC